MKSPFKISLFFNAPVRQRPSLLTSPYPLSAYCPFVLEFHWSTHGRWASIWSNNSMSHGKNKQKQQQQDHNDIFITQFHIRFALPRIAKRLRWCRFIDSENSINHNPDWCLTTSVTRLATSRALHAATKTLFARNWFYYTPLWS